MKRGEPVTRRHLFSLLFGKREEAAVPAPTQPVAADGEKPFSLEAFYAERARRRDAGEDPR
jgi:hypothetical protein